MSKSVDKASDDKNLLSVQNVVLGGVIWGVSALIYYLVFGAKSPDGSLPEWYTIGTYVFEMVAFFCATLLCFRNWRSPQIVSGRNVWFAIGLGTLLYFIGQFVFGYIELIQHQDPDVSIADLFFIPAYLCFITGMVMAVFSKRLSLEIWQWLIVVGIGAVGIATAVWLTIAQAPPTSALAQYQAVVITKIQEIKSGLAEGFPLLEAPANAQQAPVVPPKPATAPAASPSLAAPPKPPTLPTAAQSPVAVPKPPTAPAVTPSAGAPSPVAVPSPATPDVPTPAVAEQASFISFAVSTFYLAADVALLVMATMLLLAFWGGRFSTSWRMIAAAAFSFYISDLYFRVATRSGSDYQSGGVLEVGWVMSGILFGLGAAIEYDLSTRSRRSSRRRS